MPEWRPDQNKVEKYARAALHLQKVKGHGSDEAIRVVLRGVRDRQEEHAYFFAVRDRLRALRALERETGGPGREQPNPPEPPPTPREPKPLKGEQTGFDFGETPPTKRRR